MLFRSVPLPRDSPHRRHLRRSILAEFGGRRQRPAHPRDPLGPLLHLLWPDSTGASSCDHAQNSASTRVWATASQAWLRRCSGDSDPLSSLVTPLLHSRPHHVPSNSQIRRRSSTGCHVRDGCFLPCPDAMERLDLGVYDDAQ